MTSMTTGGWFRPLTENPRLRLSTVFIFYIFQGVPAGMFYFAVPAFMAGAGASAGEIAAVVGAFSLPWSLKLVNGFLMDRYTFLPMGRRRVWIIGAQAVMVTGLLAGAVLAPEGRDVALLAALAFVISAATTFQDVSIDGLAVDILDEAEHSKAGGVMFGAQILGMALATSVMGLLLDLYGAGVAFGSGALFLSSGVAFALALRERPGERQWPWSDGAAHPRNLEISIGAWLPLLRQSLTALLGIGSLVIIPFLLARAVPIGALDVFKPMLSADYLGWSTSQFTAAASGAQLGAAVLGLTLGGRLTARFGPRTMLAVVFALLGAHLVFLGLVRASWDQPWVTYLTLWASQCLSMLLAISTIPLAMKACSPAVAATQFTIYMALANFGRPIGAWIAALTLDVDPRHMLYGVATIMALAAIGALILLRPRPSAAAEPEPAPSLGAIVD